MTFYEQLVLQSQQSFQSNYPIYAQGKTPIKLSTKRQDSYETQIEKFSQMINEAEYIVIGGASGLSAAGGGDFYYTDTPSFYENFGKFSKKYVFKGAFAGMQYPFPNRETYWGYLATFLHTTLNAPIRQPYHDLAAILNDKNFDIVTTNQDTQFIKTFDEDKVSEIQGDHRYFQCSNACTDDVWDATESIEQMIEAMGDDTQIPTELIPHCPHCGAEAFPWVRGYGNFLEGKKYQAEYTKISNALLKHQGAKTLFIELGVGRMTPMFIQEPFWTLSYNLPNANYISVNRDNAFIPEQIENKGLAIQNDIAKVLHDVRNQIVEIKNGK
ncbi:NAD-dependent protein deacetylase [Companilactobacillus insicii]|uniref:NAD-dependent protein deacetylase n=1 Tax=Companilactobacillus insicii TaxID=1732567 RepID=UPI000F767DF1|nr:NAD-dependent protein deacetylase [Companilactobacillus insicii]